MSRSEQGVYQRDRRGQRHMAVSLPRRPRWHWLLAVVGVWGAVALLATVILFVLDQNFLLVALRTVVVLGVTGAAGTVGIALLWLYRRALRAGVVRLQNDQPVDVRDLRRIGQLTAADALHSYYSVELARAEQSAFPALSHYSVRNERGTGTAPTAAIEGEVIAASSIGTPSTSLAQIQAGGVLTSRTLLAGFDGATPLRIDMRACGFIAIGGQSRSGKSHTVTLLVAQAALHDWDVAICDPFPLKPDGVMSLCRPLSGACFRQAGTAEEIARTIQLVDKIGQRRLAGDRWEKPLLLVVEEFSNIVIRRLLTPEVLDLLPAMAMAYAAVGIHAVVVGHEFSRSMLGERYGATLRRACTHRILHRLAPDAAEFLLPSGAYARQVTDLTPGRALFWGEDSPRLVSVPKVTEQDLNFAAQGRPTRFYTPWAQTPPVMAAPPSPTSLDDRIIELLTRTAQPLDGNTIATQLTADLQQTRNALTRLTHGGRVVRHGSARSYTYATP